MKIYKNSKNLVNHFKHLKKIQISKNKEDGFLDLFLFPINSRKFDYDLIVACLRDSFLDYALSRRTLEKFEGKWASAVHHAKNLFVNPKKNEGELGEFFLFCFLEGFHNAPKILTKLELKTSGEMYFHESDAVHIKRVSDNKYHLIYGESKMHKNIESALPNAFNSLSKFANEINKNKNQKSIEHEKFLISNNLEKENLFEDGEEEVMEAILYPCEKSNKNIIIDDAFSIFIGFEIDIDNETKKYSSCEFSNVIERKVIDKVEKQKDKIYKLIIENNLLGYTFYIFIVPFTEINNKRKEILDRVLN